MPQRHACTRCRRADVCRRDVVEAGAFGFVEPQRDVEVPLPLPEGGDGRALEARGELAGNVGVGNAEPRRHFVLEVHGESELVVPPIAVDIGAPRRPLEDFRHRVTPRAERRLVVADETHFVRRGDHRALLHRFHVHPRLRRQPVDSALKLADDLVGGLGRPRIDEQLAVVRRRRFGVEVVIEARRSGADEGRHLTYAVDATQRALDAAHDCIGAFEPRPGRHPDVDDELVALVEREEPVGHRRHQHQAGGEREDGTDEQGSLARHRERHHPLVRRLHSVERAGAAESSRETRKSALRCGIAAVAGVHRV